MSCLYGCVGECVLNELSLWLCVRVALNELSLWLYVRVCFE